MNIKRNVDLELVHLDFDLFLLLTAFFGSQSTSKSAHNKRLFVSTHSIEFLDLLIFFFLSLIQDSNDKRIS